MFSSIFFYIFFTAIVAKNLHGEKLSGTVSWHTINFPRGSGFSTLKGEAVYAMSYVYVFRASSGQKFEATLSSKSSELTFSLLSTSTEKSSLAFGATNWTGILDQAGEYRLVLVMNDPEINKVPYLLSVRLGHRQ